MNSPTGKHWTYFSDRPVGLAGDLLWEGETIREQVSAIAERILAPIFPEQPEYGSAVSDSITFAVYGSWGMGKSSALHMLREQAELLARKHGITERLHFCDYLAPAYEALAVDVRTTLALRILTALAGGPRQAVEQFLIDALGVTEDKDRLLNEGPPTEKTSWTLRALENVTNTLTRLVDFDRIVADFLSGDSFEDNRPHVLVVLVDDLDRCQTDFIWKVLDAIQQLSNVPNLFFILAVDQEQLRKTVEERFERTTGAANPDFALEKYVQHAVWVPDMDEDRLSRFVKELMGRFSTDDVVAQELVENVHFLQHGLRVRTPRSVKRCINTIYLDLSRRLTKDLVKEEKQLIVKERILEYVWADFHQEYFTIARFQETWGRYRRAFTVLESACTDFVRGRGQDEEQLRFQIKRIADSFGVPWDDLSLELVRYLGLPPYWFVEESSKDSTSIYDLLVGLPSPDKTSGSHPVQVDIEERFTQLYFEAETAESEGDRAKALQKASDVLQFARQNRRLLRREHCPLVGNIAINAERFDANDLALNLYRLAIELDPQHSNNLQNFVDFIVKAQLPELYTEAQTLLGTLKTGSHASHRPERTQALEVRLRLLMGEKPEIGKDVVQQMVEDFSQAPTDRTKYVQLMAFLDELKDFETMRSVTRIYYNHADGPNARYLAIRGLADMLAGSGDTQNGYEAIEMFQYLLSSTEFQDTELDADRYAVLHNYASLLYRFDYDDIAGRMWFEAYQAKPSDGSIRRSYSMYMLRAGRPDLAAVVSAGSPLTIREPVLQPHVKDLPDQMLSKEFDRWWLHDK